MLDIRTQAHLTRYAIVTCSAKLPDSHQTFRVKTDGFVGFPQQGSLLAEAPGEQLRFLWMCQTSWLCPSKNIPYMSIAQSYLRIQSILVRLQDFWTYSVFFISGMPHGLKRNQNELEGLLGGHSCECPTSVWKDWMTWIRRGLSQWNKRIQAIHFSGDVAP